MLLRLGFLSLVSVAACATTRPSPQGFIADAALPAPESERAETVLVGPLFSARGPDCELSISKRAPDHRRPVDVALAYARCDVLDRCLEQISLRACELGGDLVYDLRERAGDQGVELSAIIGRREPGAAGLSTTFSFGH